jgi:hypothetical protein
MKNLREEKDPRVKTPSTDPDANEKYMKRLEIQKDVLRKIMDPITEQIREEKLKEAKIKAKRK